MAWLLWLAPPFAVTAVVAVWCWLRGRPSRPPRTGQAIEAHRRYLDTLAVPARSSRRVEQR